MKIICFIVVLIEITKRAHSLKCHVNKQTEKPAPTDCNAENNKFCSIAEIGNKTARGCMPDGRKAGCTKRMLDGEMRRTCYCLTENCNESFDTCLKTVEPEKCIEITTPTKATAGTSKNNQTSTENDALGTSKEDQNQTEDNTKATGEGNQQSTGDDAKPTAENDEETQTPTGEPAATGGNQRVVKSNQFVFVLLILVTLIIKSL